MKKNNLGSTAACIALSWVVAITVAGCSSEPATTADAAPTSTSTSTAAAADSPCPVAFSGPNPSQEEVESDISALAADQNALYARYSAALGNPSPAPTEATLTDQQVSILDQAPGGALERLSSQFCTDEALSTGMTQRLDQAIAASVPDTTDGAPEIRAGLASISTSHPVSLLLGTTFDVCGLSATQPTLTKETNPLAADPGAVAIVTNFCPDQAGLFGAQPN
ncbi:hypothetical protein GCM10007304_33300 [Rhodococcoides trifolii]|uniref:Uncharacterized protein n=1 Tax=Rhodococcoides trifolii TaxID=908250 RepID=A0A917G0L3_9NOCA|nr:hypothetical protein [Rhodococcus trifolii]GGG16511.1 hypothetical protein GCM10007304_33300 [Rhodococcus trifolii]